MYVVELGQMYSYIHGLATSEESEDLDEFEVEFEVGV
jgi:hypothetical protein